MSENKYFWLKLKRDFFKRHDIQFVEAMPNGKDYILFYLKLLCESIDHAGNLRFSDTIPYNDQMLSIITNTNIDIVRNAINVFQQLHMIEVLDDGTFYMNQVQTMIGSECASAERVRKHRLLQKESKKMLQCNNDVTKCNTEIDIEKDKDLDKEKTFTKPTIEDIIDYCVERNNHIDPYKFFDFYESKGWMVGKNKMKDWKAAIRTWEKANKSIMEKDTPQWHNEYKQELEQKQQNKPKVDVDNLDDLSCFFNKK